MKDSGTGDIGPTYDGIFASLAGARRISLTTGGNALPPVVFQVS